MTSDEAAEPPRGLLGVSHLRDIAEGLGIRPAKQWGQNFVIDPNTIRRIVGLAELDGGEHVLEVGPGLGSLTLGLLDEAAAVTAVEIDRTLAAQLPQTVQMMRPEQAERLTVIRQDALKLGRQAQRPEVLVANLPYNVAVPVVLHLLQTLPSLQRGLVMVQEEVADRLVASPGSKVYGVPSVKAAWDTRMRKVGVVGRRVFWPEPRISSGLVRFDRRRPPAEDVDRDEVFAVIDSAFAQRRKTLRASLSALAGSAAQAEAALRAADVDPQARGETLDVAAFARIVRTLRTGGQSTGPPSRRRRSEPRPGDDDGPAGVTPGT